MFPLLALLYAATPCRAADDREQILEAGPMRARVAATADTVADSSAPGPILALSRIADDEEGQPVWIGDSRIVSPHHAIRQVVARRERDEQGRDTSVVTYSFDHGASYRVTLRGLPGDGIIDCDEEVVGLSAEDEVSVQMVWTGFSPAFRVFPTKDRSIERAMMIPFDRPLDGRSARHWRERPDVEMAGRLLPGNPLDKLGSYAAFRDVNAGRVLGIFVRAAWHRRPDNDLLSPFQAAPAVTFSYANGVLQWTFPLTSGRRFTSIVFGEDRPETGENLVSSLSEEHGGISRRYRLAWDLTYPATGRRPPVLFPGGPLRDAAERLSGDIAGRNVYFLLIHGYNRSLPVMSRESIERVDKNILQNAYACSEWPCLPGMDRDERRSLGDVADYMSILAAAPFFMPEHRLASEWLDEYEKFIELTAFANVIASDEDESGGGWRGGTFVELSQFLRASVWGNYVAGHTDGRNCFANRGMARLADWLTANISAPVNGRRLLPPWSESSSLAGWRPSSEMWLLGHWLLHYRPMAAEHLMWATGPDAVPFDRPGTGWSTIQAIGNANRGTIPPLRSGRVNGSGFVMRAAVGQPEELSLHIFQPRCELSGARTAAGSALFYYAAGKAYSGRVHVAQEQAGDYLPGFDLWTDDHYRRPGWNLSGSVFHDVGIVRYAKLAPDGDDDDRSARTEYRGGAVLLVGGDYFLLSNRAQPGVRSRFVWAVPAGAELPFIQMLNGPDGKMAGYAPPQTGIYLRESDDPVSRALVSHRHDIDIRSTSYGCTVTLPESSDRIFFGEESFEARGWRYRFSGRQGVIRRKKNGDTELALCEGVSIGDRSVTMETANPGVGFSLVYNDLPECKGVYSSADATTLKLTFRKALPSRAWFYIDGNLTAARCEGRQLSIEAPSGVHRWLLTTKRSKPAMPVVTRVETGSQVAEVVFSAPSSADSCCLEISRDNGQSWEKVGEIECASLKSGELRYRMAGLPNGTKLHVRVTARNSTGQGPPSLPYPIYVSDQLPHPPDGVRCLPMIGRARVTWGEILGAKEYVLYRREITGHETGPWTLLYRGGAFEFDDGRADGVVPSFVAPGSLMNRDRPELREVRVYEYGVAAVSQNGEGRKSRPVSTQPASWLNWWPAGHTDR